MQRLRISVGASALIMSSALGLGAQDLGGGLWQVSDLNGQPFGPLATLEIAADGRISGQGPCNQWFVRGEGSDGALFGMIGSTKMACATLADEVRFLTVLGVMTTSTISPDGAVLTLTGPDAEIILRRPDPAG